MVAPRAQKTRFLTPDLGKIYDKIAGQARGRDAALEAAMASMACSRVPADPFDPPHLAIGCPMRGRRRNRARSDAVKASAARRELALAARKLARRPVAACQGHGRPSRVEGTWRGGNNRH